MNVSSPIALIRAAVMTQLSDGTAGLNPNLLVSCATYAVPPVVFDFAGGTNVFQANIDYDLTEDSGVPGLNMLAVYGAAAAPFRAGGSQKLFNARWSGDVRINIDSYLGVPGAKVQNFEPWADAVEDAMIATMNNLSSRNFSGSGRLYGLELTALHGKCLLAGENWIVPVRFTARFEAYIS